MLHIGPADVNGVQFPGVAAVPIVDPAGHYQEQVVSYQ